MRAWGALAPSPRREGGCGCEGGSGGRDGAGGQLKFPKRGVWFPVLCRLQKLTWAFAGHGYQSDQLWHQRRDQTAQFWNLTLTPTAQWVPNRTVLEPYPHPPWLAGHQSTQFWSFTPPPRSAGYQTVRFRNPTSAPLSLRTPKRLTWATASTSTALQNTSLPLAAGTKAGNSPKLGLLRSKPLGANPQRPLESPGQHDGHLAHFAPHIKLHARYANHPIA